MAAKGGRRTAPKMSFFQSSSGVGGAMLAEQWRAAAAFEEALSSGQSFDEFNGCPKPDGTAGAGSRVGEWKREEHPKLRWKLFPMLTETHHAANIRCLHESLQWIFKGFKGDE